LRDDREAAASGFGGEVRKRLTPLDVQQKEFRVSFRGYHERDVDAFLDLVTEELQRYEAEVMRLRTERAAFDPASFDLDAETQRLLREARERAEAIVREAEARAAGIPTASGAETRSVVAPYLNREREFLQSLGSLVQEHAQTIKTMVEEARRRTETASPVAQSAPVEASVAGASETPATGAAPASPELSPGDSEGSAEDLVVLSNEEGVPGASAGGDDGGTRHHEEARSLRELFWGED
jgi:cell division initiation protein